MSTTLLPSHPHGAKLAQLFSYGWKWLEMPNEGRAEWKTVDKYPLKPRTLWAKFMDAATVIGVRFGRSTSYAMIDIDAESEYLDPVWVRQIHLALETVGIVRTVIVRSSFSGGAHIYCPFPQQYPTFSVACLIKQALEAQGLRLAPGQLETFPNEKAYGKTWEGQFTEYNGHRLPLQPGTGAALLDDDLEVIARDDLARFLAMWDNAAQRNDHDAISEAICIARANRRRRGRKASGPVAEWQADLKAQIDEGWTRPGQTNELLKVIGTYGRVFEKLEAYDLADYIERVATNSPGFFAFSSHQHDLTRRATAWALAVCKFYWPLGTAPQRETKRLETICFERAIEAQARIKLAFQRLKDELANLPIKERVIRLCKEAACSAATLYKYRSLWHPQGTAPTPPEPPPEPQPEPRPVTPDCEPVSGDMAAILAVIRESLKSTENQGVTGLGGENEACNLKSAFKNSLTPEGAEGGPGGRRGFPQAKPTPKPVENSPGVGWLPRLDWKEGAVGDV